MGSVRLRLADEGRACVVFGDVFPSWLVVVKELGLRPVMVVLKKDDMIDVVEAMVDDACLVVSGEDWSVFGS